MKDELLKILSIKIKYLEDNIDALKRMNANLERENKGLEYVRSILNLFEIKNGEYSVYNFSKLERDNFDKIMVELPHDIQTRFETENCNYEGLIYLINGINSGISLKLTEEQVTAIEYMIEGVANRQMDYLARLDGILLAKSRLDISDLDVLIDIKDRYDSIIRKIETNDYVSETEEILDAINYSRLPNEKTIEVLSYLLQYNSEIYHHKIDNQTDKNIINESSFQNENLEIDLSKPFNIKNDDEQTVQIPIFDDQPEFNNFKIDNIEETKTEEIDDENTTPINYSETEDKNNDSLEEFDFKEESSETELDDIGLPEVELEEGLVDVDFEDLEEDDDSEEYNYFEVNPNENNPEEAIEHDSDIEIGYNEVINENLETDSVQEEDSTDEINIQDLFNEYNLKYDVLEEDDKNLLEKRNAKEYHPILELLEKQNILKYFVENLKLLIQLLVYSDVDTINETLNVIEKDLSVDEKDKEVTTNIVIASLPSVFIKEPVGNHETFTSNVELFEKLGIDLIKLFDFNREVFIVNNNKILENYKIVKTYNLEVNYTNAKYLLVLPNIAEKIDYYIEAVVRDTMKNGTGKTFDGGEYIKLYPNKLNSVADTTIKRLRYSSENGKKIFGSKENSLAGEITNLKVDVLNINDEYLRSYFNNEFDELSHDEELKYERLIREEKECSLNLDETLEQLRPYQQGLRYNFEGIYISRNKLIRNYNILVKNGVDKTTALIYAACHNAVITKNEYQKIKNILSNIGGR